MAAAGVLPHPGALRRIQTLKGDRGVGSPPAPTLAGVGGRIKWQDLRLGLDRQEARLTRVRFLLLDLAPCASVNG